MKTRETPAKSSKPPGKKPTSDKSDIMWAKGNRVIAMTAGGAFLGGMVAQAPGSIIGAIAGAVIGLFAKVDAAS
jgi:hypothetical protein